MKTKNTFIAGVIGTFVVLLCCVTPILVISLAAMGLGTVTGYLDYILFPILGVFIILTLSAYNRLKKSNGDDSSCCS